MFVVSILLRAVSHMSLHAYVQLASYRMLRFTASLRDSHKPAFIIYVDVEESKVHAFSDPYNKYHARFSLSFDKG